MTAAQQQSGLSCDSFTPCSALPDGGCHSRVSCSTHQQLGGSTLWQQLSAALPPHTYRAFSIPTCTTVLQPAGLTQCVVFLPPASVTCLTAGHSTFNSASDVPFEDGGLLVLPEQMNLWERRVVNPLYKKLFGEGSVMHLPMLRARDELREK